MDVTLELEGFAACPTCGVVDETMTNAEVAVGGYWRCLRCGQRWDKGWLATVAAYDAWEVARISRTDGRSRDGAFAIRH